MKFNFNPIQLIPLRRRKPRRDDFYEQFNYTPQSDNTTADVADINEPFAAIAAILNGGIELDNISPGSMDSSIFDANTRGGWNPLSVQPTVSSGYNKGNREFDLTFPSTDLTSVLSPGMRLKLTRVTAPPTQLANFQSAASHYASKSSPSGISFTDDFTIEGWINLSSYPAAGQTGTVLSRWNGTSGWVLRVNADGTLELFGTNAGAGNFSTTKSIASLPIGRRVHFAIGLDMSTFTAAGSPVWFDGVLQDSVVSRGGTNPTSLVQAGDLQLGAANGASSFLNGKLQDVRLWSAIRNTTQIRDNMCQQIVGNETNLVGYWKLAGNFNDSHANANNLTAQNGVTATTSDSAMNTVEYAIVTKVAFSTNTTVTVFTGTDYMIPNMTLSAAAYSHFRAPSGFPASRNKWYVEAIYLAGATQAAPVQNTWYNLASERLSVPLGSWLLQYRTDVYGNRGAAGSVNVDTALSDSSSTPTLPLLAASQTVANTTLNEGTLSAQAPVEATAQASYYRLVRTQDASISNLIASPSTIKADIIRAECSYV